MASLGARVRMETQRLENNPVDNFSVELKDDEVLTEWEGTIMGPESTPYEGGVFQLDITLQEGYPFKPPKVKFATKIYHPRVKDDGSICLPILSDEWNPSLTLADVGRQVVELLQAPDAEDGAVNPEIAAQMRDDPEAYRRTAREWTERYAM